MGLNEPTFDFCNPPKTTGLLPLAAERTVNGPDRRRFPHFLLLISGVSERCADLSYHDKLSPPMHILGIGTDIIECLRIAQMIERHGELFITRVYTDHEIGYCSARKAATQHYAGRWAAKEAVLKALGTGWRRGISWRDIEIRNQPSGAPTVALRGGAREALERAGVKRIHLSISHCRSHAVAYAVAEGEEQKNSAVR